MSQHAGSSNKRQAVWGDESAELAVEVNQRALIDKVLARYSGQYTVYRELLQNADDASATTVEICFQSQPSESVSKVASPAVPESELPDLKTTPTTSLTVRNDGIVFREEDWNRLRKIAEGNPDESKIGAFGVGFYSLFSICEEPIVSSGNKVILFHWKNGGDQLFVRSGNNPDFEKDVSSDGKPWTTFTIDFREPSPMPDPETFTKFLATSLAFTVNIRTVSLFFDKHCLLSLTKSAGPSEHIKPSSKVEQKSISGRLNMKSVDQTKVQVDAKVMRLVSQHIFTKPKSTKLFNRPTLGKMLSSFFGSSSSTKTPTPASQANESTDLRKVDKVSLFLHVVSGHAAVNVSRQFISEIERATKKPPPKQTTIQLIYTNKEDFDATHSTYQNTSAEENTSLQNARHVFDGLLSDLDRQGHIFIGFSTHQTTGCAAPIAARFIPTVERESIDFQHPHVSDWNNDLLWVAGSLARIIYEMEMEQCGKLWQTTKQSTSSSSSEVEKAAIFAKATHVLKFFTFSASHPSSVVSEIIQEAFFRSTRGSEMTMMSSIGPLPASKVRLPNSSLDGFVKNIPILPKQISENISQDLMERLRTKGIILDISINDILNELSSRPLNLEEMKACLSWWIVVSKEQAYQSSLISRFLQSAILFIPKAATEDGAGESSSTPNKESDEGRVVPLSSIRNYIDPKEIPPTMPIPETTVLPYIISKHFVPAELIATFQWNKISISEWLKHIFSSQLTSKTAASDTNMLTNPMFAEKVLNLIADSWSSLPDTERKEIVDLMKNKPCIPTKQGLRIPSESYAISVQLFDDLPFVVSPSNTAIKNHLAKFLEHIGVRQHVELQLVFDRMLMAGTWSHVDLAKYLVSIENMLTLSERKRLINTSWLLKEDSVKSDGSPKRYHARDLYEPDEELRSLGLPILEWNTDTKWSSTSSEARFLVSLGLKDSPQIEKLLNLASDQSDDVRRKKALDYFLRHYNLYINLYSTSYHTMAFVPAVINQKKVLLKPTEVYANNFAAIMGFAVLDEQYSHEAAKFKIASDPSSAALLQRLLENPPKSVEDGSRTFSYLSTRVTSFSNSQILSLKTAKIVPIKKPNSSDVIMVSPSQCYFSAGEGEMAKQFMSLFTFIDFGSSSRPFLQACGTKEEPTIPEIAQELINDPKRFYSLSKSQHAYLAVLRAIAINLDSLSKVLISKMKNSQFFLGSRRITRKDEEAEEDEECDLKIPNEIVIVDDTNAHATFGSAIFFCPQEDVLESFAEALGAPRLSRLTKLEYIVGRTLDNVAGNLNGMQRLILERSTLFLHDRQFDNKKIIRHDVEWLKTRLRILETTKLQAKRTLRHGNILQEDVQSVSAATIHSQNSTVDLYIASNMEIDYFEIATGLCKILLHRQRPNDALLFMTILQTSLQNLKKRGYLVDRILNARKAEKEAQEKQEKARHEELLRKLEAEKIESQTKAIEKEKSVSFPNSTLSDKNGSLVETGGTLKPQIDEKRRSHNEISSDGNGNGKELEKFGKQSNWSSKGSGELDKPSSNIFNNLRKLMPRSSSESLGAGLNNLRSNSMGSKSGGSMPSTSTTNTSPSGAPTPMDDIRSVADKAINLSKSHRNDMVNNNPHVDQVKESQGSYCEPKGEDELQFINQVNGVRFYIARVIIENGKNDNGLIAQLSRPLERFVNRVVKPVGGVLKLNPESLHVFYDTEPYETIAFNLGGALFCNLRYYIAWHDMQVIQGQLEEALISWYFSLCHEVAHNLVAEHNAQHEFWFSNVAEMHLIRLAKAIGNA